MIEFVLFWSLYKFEKNRLSSFSYGTSQIIKLALASIEIPYGITLRKHHIFEILRTMKLMNNVMFCFNSYLIYLMWCFLKNVMFHRKKSTNEFNQSNLRFLVKNTLLNNSRLERFIFFEACINLKKTFCHLFPMERHI